MVSLSTQETGLQTGNGQSLVTELRICDLPLERRGDMRRRLEFDMHRPLSSDPAEDINPYLSVVKEIEHGGRGLDSPHLCKLSAEQWK